MQLQNSTPLTKHEIYNKNPNKCLFCGKDILADREKKLYNIQQKKYCNSSCAAKGTNPLKPKRTPPQKKCLRETCSNDVNYRYGKYCSSQCMADFIYESYIKSWINGESSGSRERNNTLVSQHVRRYLFEIHDSKCSRCNWGEVNKITGKIPLHIDHIDGDASNNSQKNLRLLCPNCHSLTSNYGALNRGKSTRKRKI